MRTSWRIETAAAALLLLVSVNGCGGGGVAGSSVEPTPTPSQGLTAARAAALVNEGLTQKLSSAPAGSTVTLDGAVTVEGATVTFGSLAVTKAPYSLSGSVSIADGADSAQVAFAGGVSGALTIDGAASGSVTAAFPMTSDFAQANAHWAIHTAMAGAGHSTFAGITVTDNGDGTFTIDGTETCGPVTITIDMLTIDPANMTINGKITIDDGNGNTAELDFNGTTVDILVNGQLVTTVDLSQIFGP